MTLFPSSLLNNLSCLKVSMEEYINNSLATGLIRPSSSTLGGGFFFMGKNHGTLCPCIDYQGLNDITVKSKNPLPLVDLSFEPLFHDRIFTKEKISFLFFPFLVYIREDDE